MRRGAGRGCNWVELNKAQKMWSGAQEEVAVKLRRKRNHPVMLRGLLTMRRSRAHPVAIRVS